MKKEKGEIPISVLNYKTLLPLIIFVSPRIKLISLSVTSHNHVEDTISLHKITLVDKNF